MKKSVLLLGFAVLQACSTPQAEAPLPENSRQELQSSGEEGLVNAWLVNELPVDGCDLHFRVGEGEKATLFVASENSLKKVTDYYSRAGGGTVPVRVSYVLTGTTRKIRCGWGNEAEYPAAEVKVITTP